MKSFSKNILALGVTTALSLGAFSTSHAATYEVVDKGRAKNLEYTYGKKQNDQGVMAVSGTTIYNYPVQFDYFSESDFNNIRSFALTYHNYYYGLDVIEDYDALVAGDPTANDLAWSKLYLQDRNKSNQNPNYEYQVVGDTAGMINLGSGSESTEVRIFDTDFDGNYSADSIVTRSTIDIIEGVTDAGVAFGTATAPYLPMEGPATETDGTFKIHWVRDHGQRGFFSPDGGETIYPVMPKEIRYGGGISAVFDMNDVGEAVGYYSFDLGRNREDYVLDTTGGCADPTILDDIPVEICIQKIQNGMYHLMPFKATLLDTGEVETTDLGLLITPHEDDERAFSSQALAINNNGVAVGYAHGWDNTNVTTPTDDERMTGSYAVIFKENDAGIQEVFDFNQPHYYFSYGNVYPFSRANDINDNGLVIGYTHDASTFVKKFFYVDTTVSNSEMEIVIPKDFFTTSKSTGLAVNNDGIIVGEAEIETHNDSADNPRRTAGFMYDTSSDSPVIIDLNTLLACDSKYNILKANDINNNGDISATAIVKEQSYDAKGIAIPGEEIDVVRAVLLTRIDGGEVDDCGLTEEKVERQGASFSGVALLVLFSLLGLRRRRITH
jgi:hypothetical protein